MRLESKAGRGDKVHVFVDGEYSFTVDADFWYTCGYSAVNEIDGDDLCELKSQAEARRAYNKALSLLGLRDHSRFELETKLRRYFDRDSITAALDKIEGMGYINDESYAEKLAQELLTRKKLSPYGIKQELLKRGISREYADLACETLEFDANDAITDLLETKFASSLSDEKGRRRTFNALVRMGYSYGDIRAAMEDYVESE